MTDTDEDMVRILTTDDSHAKLEFHCFDEFSLDGTANAVMLIGSGFCDAVSVSPIVDRCEQTIASSMATVAARTKVASMSAWITVAIAFPNCRWK